MRGSVVIFAPSFGLSSYRAERKGALNKIDPLGPYLTNQPAEAVRVGVRTPLAAAVGHWSGVNISRGLELPQILHLPVPRLQID